MGKKTLSYGDAVKLLGGQSRVVSVLSRFAGAGLTVLSAGGVDVVLSLFDLKNEVSQLSEDAVVSLRNRLTKIDRFSRSELLEAAHAVLVVSAFFAALDDLDAELNTALNSGFLELTKAEQAALAAESQRLSTPSGMATLKSERWIQSKPAARVLSRSPGLADLARELTLPGKIPGLGAGIADGGNSLKIYYSALAENVRSFATGTAVWDKRDETTRSRWSEAVRRTLPDRALIRYKERLGQLAADFPEFAFWAHRVGVEVILNELYAARKDTTELGTVLQALSQLLTSAGGGAAPARVRGDLAALYRGELEQPISRAVRQISDEVTLPSLREIYVNPSYRMLPPIPAGTGSEVIAESAWNKVEPREDLWTMVGEHLISTEATRVPLVILGQPGAGKSAFTQVLAAELDPEEYLVVRVELRVVPSDVDIQRQIEAALSNLTGREIYWPDLMEDAGNAQPVILLDGFDELLQASGLSHFDYLERVLKFQHREAELRRPVAVIVTSRTAVANMVGYPVDTVVVRLEEFDDDQVTEWLAVWNQANLTRPLPAEIALAQGDLAHQPLLLFLLALSHSDGGALTAGISRAQLYQQLFTSFCERDVAKLAARLSDQDRRREVRQELYQLSQVAFAMFNRGKQTVTKDDLITDLTALQHPQPGASRPDRTAATSTVQLMAGRFFFRLFVHQDQAVRGAEALTTYEFLHASFGEFLVAHWIVGELSRLVGEGRHAANDTDRDLPDSDALLHALLSAAVLSTREHRVLGFLTELLTGKSSEDLTNLRALVRALFSTCLQPRINNAYPFYQPTEITVPTSYAIYSANLFLLLLLIADAESMVTAESDRARLTLAELYGPSPAPYKQREVLGDFYAITRLWHSQLTENEWDSLLNVIHLHWTDPQGTSISDEAEALQIVRWKPDDNKRSLKASELLSTHELIARPAGDIRIWLDDPAGRAFREASLLGTPGYRDTCAMLLPFLRVLGSGSVAPRYQSGQQATALLALLVSPSENLTAVQRADIYKFLLSVPLALRPARLLLSQLRDDVRRLIPADLTRLAVQASPYAWANIAAYLDTAAHLYSATARPQSGPQDPFDLLGEPSVLDTLKKSPWRPDQLGRGELGKLLEDYRIGLPSSRRPGEQRGPIRILGATPVETTSLSSPIRLDQRDHSDLLDLLIMLIPHAVGALLESAGKQESSKLLDLLSLFDLLGPRHVGCVVKLTDMHRLLAVAFWIGIAQRGLPVRQPPKLSDGHVMAEMKVNAPQLVDLIRQLVIEHDFPDPFPQAHSR